MARKVPVLQYIDNNEPITRNNHYEFLHHLQSSLLLALRERERLDPVEHRHAQETLDRQRRERAKNLLEKGARP